MGCLVRRDADKWSQVPEDGIISRRLTPPTFNCRLCSEIHPALSLSTMLVFKNSISRVPSLLSSIHQVNQLYLVLKKSSSPSRLVNFPLLPFLHCRKISFKQNTMSSQIPQLMSGVIVEKTGGTEVLQYKTDLPVPTPKEGEVLVKNEVSGINYIDTYYRSGLYPSPKPEILGRDAAGIIVAIGPKVEGFEHNDRVVWMGTAGYAQYTAAPAAKTIKVPKEISLPDACAALLQGLTAMTLTEESHHVDKGDWVLVLAASGGVGGWLCQILKAKGAHTIATVGSRPKVQIAKDAGADVVLVEGEDDVKGEVMKRTNGEGVRAVFDGVGKATFDRDLEVVARKGSVVSFGNASGAVEPLTISCALPLSVFRGYQKLILYRRLSPKCIKLTRPMLFAYIATRAEFEHYVNELFDMMIKNNFKVNIHETYPLKDIKRAQDDLEARKTTGKLLLKP